MLPALGSIGCVLNIFDEGGFNITMNDKAIWDQIWAEGVRGAKDLPSVEELANILGGVGDPSSHLDTLIRLRGNDYREYEFKELADEIRPELASLEPSELVSQFESLTRAHLAGTEALLACADDPTMHVQLRRVARARARPSAISAPKVEPWFLLATRELYKIGAPLSSWERLESLVGEVAPLHRVTLEEWLSMPVEILDQSGQILVGAPSRQWSDVLERALSDDRTNLKFDLEAPDARPVLSTSRREDGSFIVVVPHGGNIENAASREAVLVLFVCRSETKEIAMVATALAWDVDHVGWIGIIPSIAAKVAGFHKFVDAALVLSDPR